MRNFQYRERTTGPTRIDGLESSANSLEIQEAYAMSRRERTALITGSGQMIGRGIALPLAEAGFNIILNGSKNTAACESVAEELASFDVDTLIAMGNVGKKDEALGIAKAGLDEFGTIDVLVNNAAIRPHSGFLEISEEEWDQVQDVNLNSVIWLSKACLPGMMEKQWGRIVTFTGMNAQRGYNGAAAVSVSKHGNWGLTKSLSDEFGQYGITTNIISPGTFPGDNADLSNDERRQKLKETNPMRRLGLTTEIGGMIAYLCSEDGGFVNGQMLQINGGAVVQF
ncbi:MAG TPA: 3-oxoacyl-ACP reductase [Rhodospirillaceae bacterium]|nr:3-oxoacyl-ACP reductase [Rhodospirillaceae bacterium]